MKKITTLGFKASAILFSSAVLFACSNNEDPGWSMHLICTTPFR
ncbi:hypothetical protein [Pontibacter rugosus]